MSKLTVEQCRTFGDRLRYARQQKDWSQEYLGARTGLSYMTIGRYERGDVEIPSMNRVALLAEVLGVEPDWLIKGE